MAAGGSIFMETGCRWDVRRDPKTAFHHNDSGVHYQLGSRGRKADVILAAAYIRLRRDFT
jgi:hypothetical protein